MGSTPALIQCDGVRLGGVVSGTNIWASSAELGRRMSRKWFCVNLYLEPLDDQASLALMLEVLFNEGGFYVPLSTLYTADHQVNYTLNMSPGADLLDAGAGIFGAVQGSPGCHKRLMEVYDCGSAGIMPFEQLDRDVVRMGFWDGTVSQCMFAAQTQILGAGQIVALADQAGDGCLDVLAYSGHMSVRSLAWHPTDRLTLVCSNML